MKYFLISLFIITLQISNAQSKIVRHEIQDYENVNNLRAEIFIPQSNDKVFVKQNAKLYYYDSSDNSSADDGLNTIVQTPYRWKCLNCKVKTNLVQDSILVSYDDLNNEVDRDTIRFDFAEKRICLNTATPAFTPADLNNPLVSEVDAWATANLTIQQRENGTKLVYFVAGDGGSCDVPDYEWTLNKGNELITLSNKRVFNTKTVYVDAGSGSDITGRRGYREFPFKTLDAAIVTLQDGDLLRVFPGSYSSSISSNKIFHIHCDDGVNWHLISPLASAVIVNTPTTVNWIFDRIYTTISPTTSLNLLKNVNYGVNLTIKNAEYIYALNNGSSKNFVSQYWHIDNSFNSHFTPSTLFNQYTLPISSIKINNIYKDSDFWNIGCQLSENSVYYIDMNAAQWKSTGNVESNFFGKYFASESNTNNKTIYFNCKSLRTSKNIPLNSYPVFTDNITAETGTTGMAQNTALRVVNVSNNDVITFNLEGTFNTHTVGNVFYGINRYNSIYTYNIKGRQYKGFAIYTKQNYAANNNEIHINIDVQSDDHAAVYIGLDGTSLSVDATVYITGKIKVTRSGFPCIILGANQNNRVVLKDLVLINDGTVSPIMINSSTPENVAIQNVKSNSLITDPNIIEVGESIVRNSNYK